MHSYLSNGLNNLIELGKQWFNPIKCNVQSLIERLSWESLLGTVEDMLASYDDRINLSLIKDNLIKRCQFNQRAYGYRSFSDFFNPFSILNAT